MIYGNEYGLHASFNPGSYSPNRTLERGLAGPLNWIEGVLGVESAPNILSDAYDMLTSAGNDFAGSDTTIHGYLTQAQSYAASPDSATQVKSAAVQAEAVGAANVFTSLQSAYLGIMSQITGAQTNSSTTQQQALGIFAQVKAFQVSVSAFKSTVSHLSDDVSALVKFATTGPGLAATLENSAVHSISTLTWLLGSGLLVYFMAPTFIPRIVRGLSNAGKK